MSRERIEIEAKQGSKDWLQARLMHVTGSAIAKAMAGPAGKLSAGAKTYASQLANDGFCGFPEPEIKNKAMERGNLLEPIAREAFESYMQASDWSFEVYERGFIQIEDDELGAPSYLGCSLDGETSDGGIVEIKCRGRKAHLEQFKKGAGKDTIIQMNWNMFIAEVSHCYFVAYTDELPIDRGGLLVIKYMRDQVLIDTLEAKAGLIVTEAKKLRGELEQKVEQALESMEIIGEAKDPAEEVEEEVKTIDADPAEEVEEEVKAIDADPAEEVGTDIEEKNLFSIGDRVEWHDTAGKCIGTITTFKGEEKAMCRKEGKAKGSSVLLTSLKHYIEADQEVETETEFDRPDETRSYFETEEEEDGPEDSFLERHEQATNYTAEEVIQAFKVKGISIKRFHKLMVEYKLICATDAVNKLSQKELNIVMGDLETYVEQINSKFPEPAKKEEEEEEEKSKTDHFILELVTENDIPVKWAIAYFRDLGSLQGGSNLSDVVPERVEQVKGNPQGYVDAINKFRGFNC